MYLVPLVPLELMMDPSVQNLLFLSLLPGWTSHDRHVFSTLVHHLVWSWLKWPSWSITDPGTHLLPSAKFWAMTRSQGLNCPTECFCVLEFWSYLTHLHSLLHCWVQQWVLGLQPISNPASETPVFASGVDSVLEKFKISTASLSISMPPLVVSFCSFDIEDIPVLSSWGRCRYLATIRGFLQSNRYPDGLSWISSITRVCSWGGT